MRARRAAACFLVVALFAVACEPGATDHRTTPPAVPMATWVAGLCTALDRFGDELGLPARWAGSPSGSPADHPFEAIVAVLRRLEGDVEALGVPDIDGGAALASDVVAGVRRSIAAAERVGGLGGSSSASVGAGVDLDQAIAYPVALWLLLATAGESREVAVFLEDPARDATVARLERLLDRRRDVETVRFESKAQACRRFKKLFADEEALVENVDCDALPASFQLELAQGANGASLHDAFIDEEGVDEVVIRRLPGDLLASTSTITQGDLLELDPVRTEAPRHTECTSLVA